MRAASWLWLIRRDVLSQKARLAILVFCIASSAAIFGVAFSAFMYLRGEIRPKLREMFPERRVLLRPTSREMLFFQMEGPKISEEIASQIAAMPEVEQIYRQLSANFPVSADFQIETFGVGFSTDVIMLGVDRALVADALAEGAAFPPTDPKAPIPVVVSEYFVDAYNLGFAESAGLPKLAPRAVRGVRFDVLLGESTLGIGTATAPSRVLPAQIAGLTKNPYLFGLTVPIEQLIELNKEYNPYKPVAYSMLHVDLARPEDADAVEAKAGELNLGFTAERDKLARYLRVVGTAELLLASGIVLVLVLAGVGIFTTTAASVRERRPAWGLHRATGLGRGGIVVLATGHALAAALPAALLAGAVCLAISKGLSARFGEAIESLTFVSSSPFDLGAPVFLAIFAASVVLAVLPAWCFAVPIALARPVKLLSEKSL